jgi:hypothetical protein
MEISVQVSSSIGVTLILARPMGAVVRAGRRAGSFHRAGAFSSA